MLKLDEVKKRYIIATWKIQRAMDTLCLYSNDKKVEEYLKKIEDAAEYYVAEEEKLMKGE